MKQLFILMYLFEIGSAIVVGLGVSAKQDAWIATLLGMAGGLIIFLIYGYLHIQYPAAPLTTYIQLLLGKYIGFPVALIYILYFFYIATRVLRDCAELLISSAFDETPLLAVITIMMVVISIALYHGIEVIGRTSEIIFGAVIFMTAITGILILSSDIVRLEKLLPILEGGWKPVLKTAFPLTFTFPFGETVVFTMLLPYVHKKQAAVKTGLAAITASGIALALTMVLNISVLGVTRLSIEQFPLLNTIGKINVGMFIQRLDAIALSALIIGGFFKILIFYYAALFGIRDLFSIKKKKSTLYMLSIFTPAIIAYSIAMSESFSEHIEVGLKQVPYYFHLPLQVGLPVLLFIVAFIKKQMQSSS
ncbi:MAG: GerAB/ArcD/ProY family transporter [Ectobacillus sp.]